MYSIMCVYMHHICIYNVYVYIFVVNFHPCIFFMIWVGFFLFVFFNFKCTYSHDNTTYFVLCEYQIQCQTN